ncbi:viroplasmin family protein [uncultured Ilyobacter sp.]|uniref:ribonuclease H1 domain-containing protein n=1 Tax=uncultured Ilyobacter sp. TaxID=544433 RepID=UPI0029BFF676|nr:viroplasmin family protein [uncultured Ilyobacter sp.]
MGKKVYAYLLESNNEKGICNTWDQCKKIVLGKKALYRSFEDIDEAKKWLENPQSKPKAKKNKKFYAYYMVDTQESGITHSWEDCKSYIQAGKSRYKSFKTLEEAEKWLEKGGVYQSKEEIRRGLPDGIYFDAGTGRGIGVEVRVTDKMGNSILDRCIPADKITSHGNYLTEDGMTNNFGELLGLYCAMKIALKENIRNIYGDSNLVIYFWSKGIIKRQDQKEKTLKLADLVIELRKKYESSGGKIEYISGDINPADLGFHR